MASISKRVFFSQDDKCLVLANEEWVRSLSGLGAWSRIRLGLLCAVNSNSTNSITDATFFFGLSSGSTAPSGAFSVTNFFGLSVVGSPAALSTRTLTYTANTPNPYYTATTGFAFRKFGSTITSTTMTTAAILAPAYSGQRRRIPIVLDITRQVGGGGAYTVTAYGVSSTTVAFDYRPDHLLDAIDQAGTPTLQGQALTVLASAISVNASEVQGALDSVAIYWGRSAYPLEVYAVGASVILSGIYDQVSTGGGATDFLDTYSTGSISSAGTISGGSGWAASAVFYGTANPGSQYGYAGSSAGYPFDTFESYSIGTAISATTLASGLGWLSVGVLNGTTTLSPQVGYSGTSASPYDQFEAYAVGPVVTGVTINGGFGWTGNGFIY